jgi:hypothetical protein
MKCLEEGIIVTKGSRGNNFGNMATNFGKVGNTQDHKRIMHYAGVFMHVHVLV